VTGGHNFEGAYSPCECWNEFFAPAEWPLKVEEEKSLSLNLNLNQ
jgi:hypothetical protein